MTAHGDGALAYGVHGRRGVLDLIFMAIMLGLFGVSMGYAALCERL